MKILWDIGALDTLLERTLMFFWLILVLLLLCWLCERYSLDSNNKDSNGWVISPSFNDSEMIYRLDNVTYPLGKYSHTASTYLAEASLLFGKLSLSLKTSF